MPLKDRKNQKLKNKTHFIKESKLNPTNLNLKVSIDNK